jgi:uncharacterized membrane protein HdeD (DUF308 family)
MAGGRMTGPVQPYTPSGVVAALGRLGGHWVWLLVFGFVTLAAGICAVVWPGITLLAAAILFGAQLILAGVYRLVGAFASTDASGATRVLLALLGVFSLIVGLYAVRHVLLTIVALALLLGIFWVVNGVIEMFTALSHREMAGRAWRFVLGVLSVIAGVILLAIPGISLLTLVVLVSVWLIIFGSMEISMALRIRSSGQAGVARPA